MACFGRILLLPGQSSSAISPLLRISRRRRSARPTRAFLAGAARRPAPTKRGEWTRMALSSKRDDWCRPGVNLPHISSVWQGRRIDHVQLRRGQDYDGSKDRTRGRRRTGVRREIAAFSSFTTDIDLLSSTFPLSLPFPFRHFSRSLNNPHSLPPCSLSSSPLSSLLRPHQPQRSRSRRTSRRTLSVFVAVSSHLRRRVSMTLPARGRTPSPVTVRSLISPLTTFRCAGVSYLPCASLADPHLFFSLGSPHQFSGQRLSLALRQTNSHWSSGSRHCQSVSSPVGLRKHERGSRACVAKRTGPNPIGQTAFTSRASSRTPTTRPARVSLSVV